MRRFFAIAARQQGGLTGVLDAITRSAPCTSAAACCCASSPGHRPDVFWSSGSMRSITTSSAQLADDYYTILGLSKGASDQEIKKSYYQLAKKFHPDTNKDNAQAAKRFQEVQKAYETLRDPEKRRLYDEVGRENMERMESGGGDAGQGMGGFRAGGFPGGFPFGGFGPDIFEQLFEQNPGFAQFFGRVSLSPIKISFMEAIQGTSRRIQMAGMRGMAQTTIDVNIPAGVDNGDQVEVQLDQPQGKKGQPMRVAIPIQVEPHPYFMREGSDISVKADLPLHSALLGVSVQVPTLDGTAELVVPPCSQHGTKLRLRGKGVYDVRRGTKGDMYVQLNIIMPKQLTQKQRELLAQFTLEEEKKKAGYH